MHDFRRTAPRPGQSTPQPVAMAAPELDPKTELNKFCQKFCQRPVTKTDLAYVTSKFGQQYGNQYQTIIKLNCIQGQEYAGNLSSNPKDAEKSAAQQALLVFADQIAALAAATPKDVKRPVLTPAELAAKRAKQAAEGGENPAITPKTKLNSMCMRIAKRFLQKGETVYECRKVPGGYQATVQLAALPGEWKDRIWAGEVFATKQKAEQSAAEIALKQISDDPELSEEAALPKGKGKGKGGGKGGFGGKGWDWFPDWFWEWESPTLPRERVLQEKVTGEVLDWKDHFGWIKPHAGIDHPASSLRDGKIYVNKKDLSDSAATLSQGMSVKFYVYGDPSGLGAEEVETL